MRRRLAATPRMPRRMARISHASQRRPPVVRARVLTPPPRLGVGAALARRRWYVGEANANNKDHRGAWATWHTARLDTPRNEALSGKVLDHTRIFVLRMALLLPIAARLELRHEPPGASTPSYRVLLLFAGGGLLLGAQLVVWLLCSQRTLCRLCISGLEYGSRALAWLYRTVVVLSAGTCAALMTKELAAPHCDLTLSAAGWSNAGLFLFAALLLSTYVLQLCATLRPPGDDACCGLGGRLKRQLIEFADFYYFGMDVCLSLSLIFMLSVLSMLPLLRLQSMILFNREFAKVIQTKLSRAALLKRILS